MKWTSILFLIAALLQTAPFPQAQPEPAAPAASVPAATPAKKTTLDPDEFTTRSNGQIVLVVSRDSPIFAEFQGSSALTQRLRESLQARGFELAPDTVSSKAALQFRGDIVQARLPRKL